VLLGDFDEFLQHLHRVDKLLGKFFGFLVLPGAAEGGETGLQRARPRLHIVIEAFEFLREAPDFLRIHDCLGHR
jgi:hypothetical protein